MTLKLLLQLRMQLCQKGISSSLPVKAQEMKEQKDDYKLFLCRRISFLTLEEMHELEPGRHLGSGHCTSVRGVVYQDTKVIVTAFLDPAVLLVLLKEFHISVTLDRAGWVLRPNGYKS